jgi:hypothetical protein
MAWEILMRRVTSVNTADMQLTNFPLIGKDWVRQFLQRHSELRTVKSARIDFSRWKDTTPETINDWFMSWLYAGCGLPA